MARGWNEAPSDDGVDALIEELQRHRDMAEGEGKQVAIASTSKALFDLTTRALAASATSIGECRKIQPFKPLKLILEDDGLYCSCTHDPPHRSRLGP